MRSMADLFAPDGVLAERLPGYTFREAQARMAGLVADALEARRHTAIEAGTGIGKTFAYLVPVLESGRRTIVSTGTRTLQDQLFARDLPRLGRVLGRPVDVALLKGRNNYLCWHRLALAQGSGELGPAAWQTLEAVRLWGERGGSGDLTELEDLGADDSVRPWVTSTTENCLGTRCAHIDRCFVAEARRRALGAQVVIVNHHLLLADLALKDSGFGELLPGADAVIIDEAHLLPDVAQQFYGVGASTRELETLARDATIEARAAGRMPIEQAAAALAKAAADTRLAGYGLPLGRLPWAQAGPRIERPLAGWAHPLEALRDALDEAGGAAFGRLSERCAATLERLARIADTERGGMERAGMERADTERADKERADTARADTERAGTERADGLRWVECTQRSLSAHWTPLDVGSALAGSIDQQAGTWIFASATLAVGGRFSHFLSRVGLPDAEAHVLPSPFDYRRNARLYLPQGLPPPSRDDFVDALLADAWPLVEAAEGGAFLLFTSYRALNAARAWIERHEAPGPVLVQGEGSRSRLLDAFRDDGHAVLLGTGSFWQGVDVQGAALRVVVIDKLPFAVPGDPLVKARLDAIRRDGGDPFNESQLPEAVLTLKQGVGRLIRDFDDRGLVVLGDPRLRTRGYGRMFIASLPPIPVVDDFDAALEFAATLAQDARRGDEATVARDHG